MQCKSILTENGVYLRPVLNFSPELDDSGVATYYLQYKTRKFEATVGYFYEQFGSGLILRNWEDRQLGLNNALLGGRIKYMPTDYLSLTALYGKQRVGFETADSDIFGFNTETDTEFNTDDLRSGTDHE